MSTPKFGRRILLAALIVPATLAAAGSGAAQGNANTATIRFRAFGAEGAPAPDLKAADLSLKVDGKPRQILSVQWVDLRATASEPAAKTAVEPPFATNVASAKGRDLYILIDEESIAPGREVAVKEAANHLLAGLGADDRAALMSIRQGGPSVAPTTDREQMKKAIASLGGFGNPNESAMDLTCRTVRGVQVLQSVFAGAANSAAPAVVFLSTSVAALQAGRVTMIGAGTDAVNNDRALGELCQLRPEDFQRLSVSSQSSGVAFYAVEMLEASARPPLPEATGGLENLAGTTNGELLRAGPNVQAQMTRIAQGLSYYYIATFAAQGNDLSPGVRQVELTSSRGGITLRAPRALSLARTSAKSTSPRDMIRSPGAFTDLPLRASAFASRNPGDGKVRILSLFETDPGVTLNSAMVGMYNQAGTLTAQWTAQSADLAGPTSIAALVVPDGTYRLRVAATDSTGRSGAVDIHNFSATLVEAGPIKLGDLVLGRIGQSGPAPVMQFTSEPEAIAMVELYGRPAGGLKMYVEVLDTPGGPIQVALVPAATSEQDKFILSAKIPIATLKPGDYTVRAIVGVEGQPEAQITTTMRKISGGS